jgi:dihydroneopterin aldolase
MEGSWMLAEALRMHRRPLAEAGAVYQIFVRNLLLPAHIGVYEHEKQGPQRVRVNALLTVDREAGDNMRTVVNYESVVEAVRDIAGSGHIELVEIFAARVLAQCFEDRRVQSAWVSVEKLDPYPEAESVGVIMERHRQGPPPSAR